MKSDRERLEDILDAIGKVEKYAVKGFDVFRTDELIQSWIVRHLQIIGEASRKLSADFRKGHPEIPWKKIIGMRDILVHDYFAIDAEIVWSVVEKELPSLKRQIRDLSK